MTTNLTRRTALSLGATTAALAGAAAFAAPVRAALLDADNAGDLLGKVLDAHGGLANWKTIRQLDVTLTASGPLFGWKGQPGGLDKVSMRLNPHKPEMVITPFMKPGQTGHYTAERVWIEDAAGKTVAERTDFVHRLHSQKLEEPWDALDLLAFVSYANWEYLVVPFLLAEPDVKLELLPPHQEYGKAWQRLHATFPARIPLHSLDQTFYFDEKYLLRRFDYQALGPAAEYCFDPATFGGIVFPTLRRIVPQGDPDPLFSASTAVLIQIADIKVVR